MIIPKIKLEQQTFSCIGEKLLALDTHKIDHANWTNNESYPEVAFKIAHDGENIILQFHVKEDEIRAVAEGNHSNVWEDSCVEFFISFDDSGFYYNLEQSCIGEALLGFRKERDQAIHSEDKIIDAIKRESSLGNKNFELKKGNFEWTLTSIIPISSFWKHDIKSLSGVKAKANFYKCGDELSQPHYLSWNPVNIVNPDFHRVDFFKDISFE